jgi:hypothetical protein
VPLIADAPAVDDQRVLGIRLLFGCARLNRQKARSAGGREKAAVAEQA